MSKNNPVSTDGGEQPAGVLGIDKVTEGHAPIYMKNFKAHKPGISHEEMVEAYNEWASTYDEDINTSIYNGVQFVADVLEELYEPSQRENLKILDVAAGTGLVGSKLDKLGFKSIDALEPSCGMLKILTERNIYGKKYLSPIGDKATHDTIPEKIYDVLVISGGMGEGHIPVNAINEMIRLVKAGGKILIVMREEYLTYVAEYVNKLEPLMREYEDKGYWKKLRRTIVPNYSFNKNGLIFLFEVTSNTFPI